MEKQGGHDLLLTYGAFGVIVKMAGSHGEYVFRAEIGVALSAYQEL